MLRWALIFAVIAIIAGLLGFTGIAGTSMAIAKTLFYIFLVISCCCWRGCSSGAELVAAKAKLCRNI